MVWGGLGLVGGLISVYSRELLGSGVGGWLAGIDREGMYFLR